jgi:hypothetical protein
MNPPPVPRPSRKWRGACILLIALAVRVTGMILAKGYVERAFPKVRRMIRHFQ